MRKAGFILLYIAVAMISLGITLTMIDFYNDYQCSITTDVKWFIENDCVKYVR